MQLPQVHRRLTYEMPHTNLSAYRNTKSMGRIDHFFGVGLGTTSDAALGTVQSLVGVSLSEGNC